MGVLDVMHRKTRIYLPRFELPFVETVSKPLSVLSHYYQPVEGY